MAQKKPMVKHEVAKSTLYAYDISRLRNDQMSDVLMKVVNDQTYHELMKRRAKVFKGLMGMTVEQDRTGVLKEIESIDKRVKNMIFNALVDFDHVLQQNHPSRNITLREYFKDFCDTREKRELYGKFTQLIDVSTFLGDMMEDMLMDAQEILKQLDPTCLVSETEAIKRAVEPLHSYTSIHNKTDVQELFDIYCKYSDDAKDKLYPLCCLFVKEYKQKVDELVAAGKINEDLSLKKY